MDNLKVLICDDSKMVINQMRKYILASCDASIFEASDGEIAIQMYKEQNPDLVIMDIVMPKITGIEALSEIMKFDSKAKVIMASSVGTQKHLKEAITLGAIDFLQKPVTQDIVDRMLQHFIEGRE